MNAEAGRPATAMQLLERMFDVEIRFLQDATSDVGLLASAFHPDVTIHEPETLPYAGDWTKRAGVAALFQRMREVWSQVSVEGLRAVRQDAMAHMYCTISLTARDNGATIRQPFAEVLRFEGERLIDGTPFYFDTAAIVAALGK